jgi:hypothetical protein
MAGRMQDIWATRSRRDAFCCCKKAVLWNPLTSTKRRRQGGGNARAPAVAQRTHVVGEVPDLARVGLARARIALQVDVGVAVQVERGEAVDVLAQQRLRRLAQVEDLRVMPPQSPDC